MRYRRSFMQYSLKALILLLITPVLSFAAAVERENSDAYWDYGAGFGAIRFEHYPASNEFKTLALPSPTFQYRGKIVRADDRDGAHLYLLKSTRVTLELSGQGSAALASKDSQARRGMEDLPWMLALGPQLVARPDETVEFAFGVYQAISTDFVMTRAVGAVASASATYKWTSDFQAWGPFQEDGRSDGRLAVSVKGGSDDFLSLYFAVPENQATAERPSYEARAGLLSTNLSYFQSFRSGRAAIYVGAGVHNYDISANRQSPLHKSDHNFTALIGFNYTLGESSRPAVPEEETSGVINSFHRDRELLKDP